MQKRTEKIATFADKNIICHIRYYIKEIKRSQKIEVAKVFVLYLIYGRETDFFSKTPVNEGHIKSGSFCSVCSDWDDNLERVCLPLL